MDSVLQLYGYSHTEQVITGEKCLLLSKEYSFVMLFVRTSWRKCHQKFCKKNPTSTVLYKRTIHRTLKKILTHRVSAGAK
jgi:hypothetical protein